MQQFLVLMLKHIQVGYTVYYKSVNEHIDQIINIYI